MDGKSVEIVSPFNIGAMAAGVEDVDLTIGNSHTEILGVTRLTQPILSTGHDKCWYGNIFIFCRISGAETRTLGREVLAGRAEIMA